MMNTTLTADQVALNAYLAAKNAEFEAKCIAEGATFWCVSAVTAADRCLLGGVNPPPPYRGIYVLLSWSIFHIHFSYIRFIVFSYITFSPYILFFQILKFLNFLLMDFCIYHNLYYVHIIEQLLYMCLIVCSIVVL